LFRTPKLAIRRAAGFSLVEIMVGLAIGMLAIIVMMQVFALSEGRKRNATSGGDAQSNGVISFYQLPRDVGQAGYGFAASTLFGCNLTWKVASGSSITTAIPLAPVTINPSTSIIPAGDLNTDTLLVMYGNTNGEPQGNIINAQAATLYTVQMPTSFTVGDRVIAASAACAGNLILDSITVAPVPPATATTVTVATGATGTTLYNLGQTPTVQAYAIRGGNLTVCDYLVNDCGLTANTGNAAIWVPTASNIVSMRAVYWKDTSVAMDGIPDANGHDQTSPTTGCGWARTSAIDMVLVARSSQYDKKVVTTTAINTPSPVNAPTWAEDGSAPIIAATGTMGPDAAADEPWKHYRYKVFQSVVPIRNVTWMGVPTGC